MSISTMSLIEIIAPREQAMDLLTGIQDFGFLQMEEVPLVVPGTRSFLHRDQLTPEQQGWQRTLREVLRIVSELDPLLEGSSHPAKSDLAKVRSELSSEEADYFLLQISRMKRKADSLLRKRHNIKHDIHALERYRHRLDQLSSIFEQTKFSESMTHIALLVVPEERRQIEALESRISDLTKENTRIFYSESVDKQSKGVDVALIAFPSEYTTGVQDMVRGSGLAELRLPKDVRDLPLLDAIKKLQAHLKDLPSRLQQVNDSIAEFRTENQAMIVVIDQVSTDTLARLDSVETIAHSQMLTVVHAWIPQEELSGFNKAVKERFGETVVVSEIKTVAEETGNVPVRLKNIGLFKPFERLLQIFSVPLYGSFDPTPLMAVVFPLFFGLILGDAAYGLIILGATLWARRRWKHSLLAKDITTIAIWCASASIMFGVIFGEFLGDIGERSGLLPVYIGGMKVLPLWQSREHVIDELLVITIVIGFCHVVLGLVLGIVESLRMKRRRHFWESLGLLLGLLSIVMFILPVTPEWLHDSLRKKLAGSGLIASIIMLIKGSGVAGPIELISLVANVLSYCRLMALGVAGMVIANLANSLAASQENVLVGLLVAIPIHILAIALGVLEPTIHALRLHYVEFLPKFFIGDGRLYEPLQRKEKTYAE